jgi:hypothetical protein
MPRRISDAHEKWKGIEAWRTKDIATQHGGLAVSDFWYFRTEANIDGELVITSGGTDWNTISGFQLDVYEPRRHGVHDQVE